MNLLSSDVWNFEKKTPSIFNNSKTPKTHLFALIKMNLRPYIKNYFKIKKNYIN